MGCTNLLDHGFSKKIQILFFKIERKTFSLNISQKEREKKNDPNKKENLKNLLVDGLSKSFDYGFQRYNGSWIPKKVFKTPILREETVSLHVLKKE